MAQPRLTTLQIGFYFSFGAAAKEDGDYAEEIVFESKTSVLLDPLLQKLPIWEARDPQTQELLGYPAYELCETGSELEEIAGDMCFSYWVALTRPNTEGSLERDSLYIPEHVMAMLEAMTACLLTEATAWNKTLTFKGIKTYHVTESSGFSDIIR
jgi:hypothetical protein